MTEKEKRMHRICFTGHRPEKLTVNSSIIKTLLESEIQTAYSNGYNVYISGMARGVDIWAAEIVLKMKDKGNDIKLICACPYIGFENNWSEPWKKRYQNILAKADFVKFISQTYSTFCFQKRNCWMVNHSARLIAVFNGKSGGTKNTLEYAKQSNVPIIIING